jgi:hypothetical protein
MFSFETLACLHDIPVVRSSTIKIQDVYAKAKDTTAFIRLPCNLAETIANKSLKIALTVANPFVKPLRGPVRVIDDFAVQKIRQIEAKYPVIKTPTEEVVNTFNEKTEPVRNVMNSVKDTTTSTIQHGKETVSNVANATVNKATNVADTVYTFCETHVPGKTVPVHRYDFGRRTTLLWERIKSTVGSFRDYLFQSIQLPLIWFRMSIVFFLLKIKQTNDGVLNKMQNKPFLSVLPQRFLIIIGSVLEYMMARIRPDDHTVNELNKTKQQSRLFQKQQQQKQFVSRQTMKPDAFVTTRQSIVVTKQDTVITRNNVSKAHTNYSNMTDKEELYPRLNSDHIESVHSDDITKLHTHLKPTDVELLYSRLPVDIIPTGNNEKPLTQDQQMLHAKIIAAELERQGYVEEDNYD